MISTIECQNITKNEFDVHYVFIIYLSPDSLNLKALVRKLKVDFSRNIRIKSLAE